MNDSGNNINDLGNGPSIDNLIQKEPENNKKELIMLIIIVVLTITALILVIVKPKKVAVEVEKTETLSEVGVELASYIGDKGLDALDTYGITDINRVAIDYICEGVVECNKIKGDAVREYASDIIDDDTELTDIPCSVNDGVLYTYDETNDMFVKNAGHDHDNSSISPLYTKVNRIKKKSGKYVLTLNKLYYNSSKSEYISSEPNGINKIYNVKGYLEDTGDIDVDRLGDNYENDFSKLKNKGTKYQYTFVRKNNNYILEKYEVLSE